MVATAASLPPTPALTEIPFLLAPEGEALFARRADRLKFLAMNHAMGDYLGFIAAVCRAQQQALRHFPPSLLPARIAGQAPLSIGAVKPPTGWLAALHQICAQLLTAAPEALSPSLTTLSTLDDALGESLSQSFLQGDFASHDLGRLVLVGAALQVGWMALLRDHGLPPSIQRGAHDLSLCPVCGGLPVGSSVEAGTGKEGLRYLRCALCATCWNVPRIHCIHCGDTETIAYYHLEGTDGAVRAEACDRCGSYSKVLQVEKSLGGELLADDLATLALDLLMQEAGYQRYGFNPLLLLAD